MTSRRKARGGLEPPFEDLQSFTLPLCYLANKNNMKFKNHPTIRNTTLVLSNGASYQTQWIISSKKKALEMDNNNNILWKTYQDTEDLGLAKRVTRFNDRFGSLGLDITSNEM